LAWQTLLPPEVQVDEQVSSLFQREIDWLCMRSSVAVNSAQQPGIRYFLADFQFGMLSPEAACQVFLGIFWTRQDSYFQDSSYKLHPLSLADWKALMSLEPLRRSQFSRWLATLPRDAIHVLHALDKLARHAGGELLLIWVTELFFIAYVQVETRETLFQICQPLFSAACTQDSRCISILVSMTVKFFKYIDRAAVPLFKSIDLWQWQPSALDLKAIQFLLFHDYASGRSELGRYLLDSLCYGYKVSSILADSAVGASDEQKNNSDLGPGMASAKPAAGIKLAISSPTLILPAALQQQIVLLLAEVRIAHLLSQLRASTIRDFPALRVILGSKTWLDIPASWWTDLLCSMSYFSPSGRPLFQATDPALLVSLKSRLLERSLSSDWADILALGIIDDQEQPSVGEGGEQITQPTVETAAVAGDLRSRRKSVSASSTTAAVVATAAESLVAVPLEPLELDKLLRDPVLFFIDAQLKCDNFAQVHKPPAELLEWPGRTFIWPAFSRNDGFEPLAFKLIADFLPYVASLAAREDRILRGDSTGGGVSIVGPLLALDRPRISFLQSRITHFPKMQMLIPLCQAHVLNACAIGPRGESS
jgi:hypothetical protein